MSALNLSGVGGIGSTPDQLISQASTRTFVPLQPEGQSFKLPEIGNTAGKRHIRMQSRYQQGHIERLGAWIYIRFRVDTPEGRRLVAKKICPAEGAGSLTAAQQRRRGQQIIEDAGVNDQTKTIAATLDTTFRQQAEWFLRHAQERDRKPVAPSTIQTWRSMLDKYLDPLVGNTLLAEFNNAAARSLMTELKDNDLSAKTVNNIFGFVKMVVASAINEDGEPIFDRKWNHEYIDVPLVDKMKQHKPTFSTDDINRMLAKTDDAQLQILIVLAAASGMRIGEILGLNIDSISLDGTTITVSEKAFGSEIQDFLKTANGRRIVDLDPQVGKLLREYIGSRTGLVFSTRKGKPLPQSNILRRQLHPLLEQLGLEDCGFHAFRRYRITHLRKAKAPEGLVQFWAGHSGTSITDGYDRIREDVEFRQEVAKSAGVGFTIPASVVQKVHRLEENQKGQTVVLACPV